MGQKYYNLLTKLNSVKIYIYTKREIKNKHLVRKKNDIKKIKLDFAIIANETSSHYKTLRWIDKNFSNVKILIEKPLFHKYINYSSINKVFIGYNLRFHPIVNNIKEILKKIGKIKSVHINCMSNLNIWNNRDFKNSYSFNIRKGGGVELDLSHEIDLLVNLFGKVNYINALNLKKSKFHNSSNDILLSNGITNKGICFSLNLDYFSLKDERYIKIIGDKFYIEADFIKNHIIVIKNNSKEMFKFKNNPMANSYKIQLNKFLNENNKKDLCIYSEGLYINNIISRFKKKI